MLATMQSGWCCAVIASTVTGCGFPPLPKLADHGPGASIDASIDASVDASVDTSMTQPFLSCASLAPTCGGARNDDCCRSLAAAGGSFYRSYDPGSDGLLDNMNFPAQVSAFRLDKYEVTVGRFRAFVNAGMGTQSRPPAAGAGARTSIQNSGWATAWTAELPATMAALIAAVGCDSTLQTWTDSPAQNEQRPMNCISWYEAMAFCVWDQGFLPTEAEWNYAAAGGALQRGYPWSSPSSSLLLDGSHASYNDNGNCVGDGQPGCAVTDLVPVGSKPAGDGLWGQSDLAGNVYEWTLDWFAQPYPMPCADCANVTPAAGRSIRGGGFVDIARDQRTGFRDNLPPSQRDTNVGVRCARLAE